MPAAAGAGCGMTTQQVLSIVEARGLKVVIVDGRPALRGPKDEATPHLLAVLKRHREKILALHGIENAPGGAQAVQDEGRSVECRWSTGHVETHWIKDGFPLGAQWWRGPEDTEWREIPEADQHAAAEEAKAAVRAWETVAGPSEMTTRTGVRGRR